MLGWPRLLVGMTNEHLHSVRTLYNPNINGRKDSRRLCCIKETGGSVWRITWTDFCICVRGWTHDSGETTVDGVQEHQSNTDWAITWACSDHRQGWSRTEEPVEMAVQTAQSCHTNPSRLEPQSMYHQMQSVLICGIPRHVRNHRPALETGHSATNESDELSGDNPLIVGLMDRANGPSENAAVSSSNDSVAETMVHIPLRKITRTKRPPSPCIMCD